MGIFSYNTEALDRDGRQVLQTTKSINRNAMQKYAPAGIKYDKYGSRSGIKSALDTELMAEHIDREQKALGQGFYRFALTDDKGRPLDDAQPLNFNGTLYYPNEDGVFTVFDEDYMKVQKEKHDQVQRRINDALEYACVSDETCAQLIGADAFAELATGRGRNIVRNMVPELVDANAVPSYLAGLHPNSVQYGTGMSKLRLILSKRLPIIEHATPNSVKNELE